MACYIAIASWWIAYRMLADLLEKGFIMDKKKENHISFTLPSGITFYFSNNWEGLHEMADLLDKYGKLQGWHASNEQNSVTETK